MTGTQLQEQRAPLAVFTREEMFRDPVGWGIMAVLGTVVGLVIGHSWFREGGRGERA